MFIPAGIILGTTNELVSISYQVTYTDEFLGSFPVTLTALDENPTIVVEGNTVSGFYSDSFNNSIDCRMKDHSIKTLNKFTEFNPFDVLELIHYRPDMNRSVTYRYLAEANSQSQIYEVIVTNNWTYGRDNMLIFMDEIINARSN